jgi:hypothetical protein
LEVDDLSRKRDDLLASWSGLVASHETAPLEMEAVARSYALAASARSRTTEDPVYDVILSTALEKPLTSSKPSSGWTPCVNRWPPIATNTSRRCTTM